MWTSLSIYLREVIPSLYPIMNLALGLKIIENIFGTLGILWGVHDSCVSQSLWELKVYLQYSDKYLCYFTCKRGDSREETLSLFHFVLIGGYLVDLEQHLITISPCLSCMHFFSCGFHFQSQFQLAYCGCLSSTGPIPCHTGI